MQFSKSVALLAALSSSAIARSDGHAHHHIHHARDLSTVTLTTQRTVTVCPCDSSTISTASIVPTTTSTSVSEYTPTSTLEYTSTPEPTTVVTPTTSTSSVPSTSSSGAGSDWSSVPSDGVFSTSGFGDITTPYNLTAGNVINYVGNIGSPYGSNIQEVSASEASSYKYVVQFKGSNTVDWIVKIWNKIGSDAKVDGFFNGHACHSFTLAPGETRYWAFNTNTQGGWAAAEGSDLPTNSQDGAYAATWGEIDFGNEDNSGWSGYDVSAIQAQKAGKTIQGMKICNLLQSSAKCSTILPGGTVVNNNAYITGYEKDGLGGNLEAGPVRLTVEIDYKG